MAYEAAYNEARCALYRRGLEIGRPEYGEDGVRRCPVAGVRLADPDLLREAWGEDLTREILNERLGPPLACYCCMELWTTYYDFLKRYVRLYGKELPTLSFEQLSKLLTAARRALLDHANTHSLHTNLSLVRSTGNLAG